MSEKPPAAVVSLMVLGGIAGIATMLPIFAATAIGREFSLSERDLVLVTGVISLGAFGTFALTRLADRHGRRPVLRGSLLALGPAMLAAAFAPGLEAYVAVQLVATALRGALGSVISVAITEVSSDRFRAANHAWYGVVSAGVGGFPLGLVAAFGDRSDARAWLFGSLGLLLIAALALWRHIPETGRFERSAERGESVRTRARELFAPEWRRRAIGLVVVGVLRGAAIGAVGFYAFYHATESVGLSSAIASAIFAGGGTLGIAGNPIGAVLSERWGRRPTQVAFALLTLTSGVLYYWVPAGLGVATPLLLALAFCGYVLGVQAFSVADRLVDTELFPTRLRATYAGARMIGDALAQALQNFGLAAAILAFGNMPLALAVFVPLLALPSLALFWWVTTESRGLTLEEASQETGSGR